MEFITLKLNKLKEILTIIKNSSKLKWRNGSDVEWYVKDKKNGRIEKNNNVSYLHYVNPMLL
jgi:hypothetical protein